MSQVSDILANIRLFGDNPSLPIPESWNQKYNLFPYQRVGVSHLLGLTRFVIGDPAGSGKTVQTLYSWAVYKHKQPSRLIVITTKTAVTQWGEEETPRFLIGVPVYLATEDPKGRGETYLRWVLAGPGSVLVLSWNVFLRDHEALLDTILTSQIQDQVWLVLDEMQRCRNPKAKIYQATKVFIKNIRRVHGLTATLIKNKAHDAFYIFKLLVPNFMTKKFFESTYCIFERKLVPLRTGKGGGSKLISIKVVKGYKDLDKFAKQVSQFYLARRDEELGIQRPDVQHIIRSIDMTSFHRKVYLDTEKGLYVESAETNAMAATAALSQAQIVANNPEAYSVVLLQGKTDFEEDLDFEDITQGIDYEVAQKENSKLSLLIDILDNELEDDPVIIYSPFRTTIIHLEKALSPYKPVVIHGRTSDKDRDTARREFQDGKTNIILITDAGGEAINLQRAGHLIMYSRPWDPGRYVQVIGRARRFGSERKFLRVWHLVLKDSVDELVDAVLESKLSGFESVVKNISSLPQSGLSLPLEVARLMRRRRLKS